MGGNILKIEKGEACKENPMNTGEGGLKIFSGTISLQLDHLAFLAKCNRCEKAQLWRTTTSSVINRFSSVTTNDTVTKLYTEFMYGTFENILYTKYTKQMA